MFNFCYSHAAGDARTLDGKRLFLIRERSLFGAGASAAVIDSLIARFNDQVERAGRSELRIGAGGESRNTATATTTAPQTREERRQEAKKIVKKHRRTTAGMCSCKRCKRAWDVLEATGGWNPAPYFERLQKDWVG